MVWFLLGGVAYLLEGPSFSLWQRREGSNKIIKNSVTIFMNDLDVVVLYIVVAMLLSAATTIPLPLPPTTIIIYHKSTNSVALSINFGQTKAPSRCSAPSTWETLRITTLAFRWFLRFSIDCDRLGLGNQANLRRALCTRSAPCALCV